MPILRPYDAMQVRDPFAFGRGSFGLGRNDRRAARVPTAFAGSVQSIIAHPAYCKSDAAKLVSCVDGSTVRWWQCAVTGTWFEMATAADQPTFRSVVGGKYYTDWNGTGNRFIFGSHAVRHIGISIYQSATSVLPMAVSNNQDSSIRKGNGTATPWDAAGVPPVGGTMTYHVNNVATAVSGGLGVYERVQTVGTSAAASAATRLSGASVFDPGGRLWTGRIVAATWGDIDLGVAAVDAWLLSLTPSP